MGTSVAGRRLGQRSPFSNFILNEARELRRRHFFRDDCLLLQLPAYIGGIERVVDFLTEPLDDVGGSFAGPENDHQVVVTSSP